MSRIIIPINREWMYKDNYSEEYNEKSFDDSCFEKVNIPHANKEVPYNYFDEKSYQFISCYRKKFVITASTGENEFSLTLKGLCLMQEFI